MFRVFKCNVSCFFLFFFIKNELFSSAIPDDAMDVDRVVDEDKDNDPDKVKSSIFLFAFFLMFSF